MKHKLWRFFYVFIALTMLVSILSPVGLSTAQTPPPPNTSTVMLPSGGQGARPDPMSKLDSTLREAAVKGGNEPLTVYILAKPGAKLKGVAEVSETRPFPPDGVLVVAKVKPSMLTKLASHPDVVAAEAFHAIEAPIPIKPGEDFERPTPDKIREMREKAAALKAAGPEGATPQNLDKRLPGGSALSSPSGDLTPTDWNGKSLIGADKAWAKGFKGSGVNIAIIDSGVDFSHPDLYGKQATYPSGPYAGWPIALDPRSMRRYYYFGNTSTDNFLFDTDLSWYADVMNVIHTQPGKDATFTFNSKLYTIDKTIVALTKSGDIRWGIHPDKQLADFVYDWVPFILLDTTTAGVYDTVIADLNFDFWFDGYDDKANKADPILAQDLGSYVYTNTVVMTGTQYVPATWFINQLPPTWYIPWAVALSQITLPPGSWIAALDHNSPAGATDGADGIPDVSGGMIYYIADGKLPIPGMDYLYPGVGPGLEPPIPLNGQLVAFMLGSLFAGGEDHGTLCASAAVAGGMITGYFAATGEWVQYDPADFINFPFPPSGDPADIMPWLKDSDEGTVQGPAPDAKIIAIGDNYEVVNNMQGFYDAYTFLAYGVDGKPNSGDEFVQIASMSYGDGSVHNDGWDWESRLISFYNQNYLPNTTFFASSGNGGHGFGTVNSPQGNTTVSVGASTQYGASDVFGGGLAASQINDGEVQPFSGRGPDAMGRPDPDVVATGAWGAGDVPLNLAPAYGANITWFVQDGNNAWYEWGGTSRAAPEAAGVAALIYEAYKKKFGSFPDFETARQILMSGADDLNHDILMQGAGRVNADRATDVAGGLSGVYVTPSLLSAGEYQGTHYESFANVLFPGDTWSQTFTVRNTGTTAKNVTVGDEVLLQTSVITYSLVVKPYTGMEDPYLGTYFYYANYFVDGDATVAGLDPIPVPANADLMQVQLLVPFELQDFNYTDPDPTTLSYSPNQRWSLTVFDWTDRNGDGNLWDDVNGDGIVNPILGTDVLDIAYTGPVTRTEINRFAYSYLYGNQQEVTVRLGSRTDIDKIIIGIVHRLPNNTRPGWGAAQYAANPLQVKVTFYKKADWTLVTENPTSLNVPAGGTATFNATFTIPSSQAPGLYEGAITVNDGTHKSIIPVTVNVAVPKNKLLFNLGGTAAAGTPYDNGRMNGGWTWYGVLEEGDWRYYYYDADSGFDQQFLYVRNQWGTHHTNMPTFNETLVWGPNPGDQFSLKEPTKYGPYGMQFAGGTQDANGPQNGWGTPRQGSWWVNGDNTPLPESRAWATLWDGLNQVQFRNVLLSGQGFGEDFAATVGVFGVDAPETGLTINTDQTSGTFKLDAVSPVNGLIAYASGFGQEQWFRNQDVPQGKHTQLWPDDLLKGWVHTFTATNLSAIEVKTFGPPSSDIDLYLMYDANGDGFFNVYDNRERLAFSSNIGSNEQILYSGNFNSGFDIQNGTYAVIMYGYQVTPGDQFDLRLVTYGGEDLNISGANASNNYVVSVTPGQTQQLTVNWKVPGSGVWNGYLWFAMPWEEEPQNWYMGPYILVPVTINASGVVPTVMKTVDKAMVCQTTTAGIHEILTYKITIFNGGNEDAWIELADLLPEGLSYVRTSREPTVNDSTTSYYARWWNDVGQYGYITPDSDGYLRLARYVGPTTSGKLYIEYRVKVDADFVGTITNKVDVTVDINGMHQFLSNTATTKVNYCVFAPILFTP